MDLVNRSLVGALDANMRVLDGRVVGCILKASIPCKLTMTGRPRRRSEIVKEKRRVIIFTMDVEFEWVGVVYILNKVEDRR